LSGERSPVAELPTPAATEALGEWLGRRLRPGEALALTGELGAGKTSLVRGLARGLGVDDPSAVSSPTYLLAVEHPGPTTLLHLDAYLPDKLRRFLADGGADYLAEVPAVIAVEWADRVRDLLPAACLWVHLEQARLRGGLDGRIARFENAAVSQFPWLTSLPGRFEPE
jgi:tRNA threonylcarbamoyladenosine biosynthesis protein TsaE